MRRRLEIAAAVAAACVYFEFVSRSRSTIYNNTTLLYRTILYSNCHMHTRTYYILLQNTNTNHKLLSTCVWVVNAILQYYYTIILLYESTHITFFSPTHSPTLYRTRDTRVGDWRRPTSQNWLRSHVPHYKTSILMFVRMHTQLLLSSA